MIALIGFIIIILGFIIMEANAKNPAGQHKHNKEAQKYWDLHKSWSKND